MYFQIGMIAISCEISDMSVDIFNIPAGGFVISVGIILKCQPRFERTAKALGVISGQCGNAPYSTYLAVCWTFRVNVADETPVQRFYISVVILDQSGAKNDKYVQKFRTCFFPVVEK